MRRPAAPRRGRGISVDTDRANIQFWNELCGTWLARSLGITDHGLDSLRRFDRAYLRLYPYLLEYVNLTSLAHRRVLEIGLGYGTLGQTDAAAGAEYVGLDLADTPVQMMRQRLQLFRLSGSCLQGSALSLPIASESMDCVISIGCLHHTGDVQRGLDEIHRVLRRGGSAVLMLYNQFSYRHWTRWPIATARALLREHGISVGEAPVTDTQRRVYDAAASGQGPPETVFLSTGRLRQMLGRFSRVELHKENTDNLLLLPRRWWLRSVGRWAGLDIYVRAQK